MSTAHEKVSEDPSSLLGMIDSSAPSARVRAVVGKTDLQGRTDLTLPLIRHLRDTAAVAWLLVDLLWTPSVRTRVAAELGIGVEELRRLVAWLAGLHDIGKAAPGWLSKIPLPDGGADLRDSGLSWTATAAASRSFRQPHGAMGQVYLQHLLRERYGRTPGGRAWPEIIGGHHGSNPDRYQTEAVRTSWGSRQQGGCLGGGAWNEVREEIVDLVTADVGAAPHLESWMASEPSTGVRAQILGLVILADWIASNSDLFWFNDPRTSPQRAHDAVESLGLVAPWTPAPPCDDVAQLLGERFPALRGKTPRPAQVALAEAARRCAGPALFILEAPMGSGKTEAALLAAEILAARFGLGGLFVGLPTMATSNPMFTRVHSWLATMGGTTTAINLAHGKAALNDEFAELIRESRMATVDDETPGGSIGVVSWLRGRKRSLLSPHVVGTVDQALMACLLTKHSVLRHVALAGKVVVIDEVHAADTTMRLHLERLLVWLGHYRTPVILMSATLPPEQRAAYVAAYAQGRGEAAPEVATSDAYPRVTVYDGALTEPPVDDDAPLTSVAIERLDDDPQTLVDLLRAQVTDGGCAAVIRNTVTRAQETYALLRAELGDDVVIFHSRFHAAARSRRERDLVRRLGPGGDRPERLVVVGTQVLEQSLDIDFDLMVTDLAPADLVLQRIGRLHRHPGRVRPDAVALPRCYVTGADWDAVPPAPVSGSSTVYGLAHLLRSAAALEEPFTRGSVMLPCDLPRIVRVAYDESVTAPAGWEKTWQKAHADEQAATGKRVAAAQPFLLGDPTTMPGLAHWSATGGQDPDAAKHRAAAARVRDGSDSLEVLLVRRDEQGTLRVMDDAPHRAGCVIPEASTPDPVLGRAIASCSVPLPMGMVAATQDLGAVIDDLEKAPFCDSWQDSHWLEGELPLVIDHHGEARVGRFLCRYRSDQGLVVTSLPKEA